MSERLEGAGGWAGVIHSVSLVWRALHCHTVFIPGELRHSQSKEHFHVSEETPSLTQMKPLSANIPNRNFIWMLFECFLSLRFLLRISIDGQMARERECSVFRKLDYILNNFIHQSNCLKFSRDSTWESLTMHPKLHIKSRLRREVMSLSSSTKYIHNTVIIYLHIRCDIYII